MGYIGNCFWLGLSTKKRKENLILASTSVFVCLALQAPEKELQWFSSFPGPIDTKRRWLQFAEAQALSGCWTLFCVTEKPSEPLLTNLPNCEGFTHHANWISMISPYLPPPNPSLQMSPACQTIENSPCRAQVLFVKGIDASGEQIPSEETGKLQGSGDASLCLESPAKPKDSSHPPASHSMNTALWLGLNWVVRVVKQHIGITTSAYFYLIYIVQ